MHPREWRKRQNKNTERIDVVVEIVHETDKAYGVSNGNEDFDLDGRRKLIWLPKSQVEKNDDGTISMPGWLAEERGLA